MTFRMVSSLNPWTARLDSIGVGLIMAVAQVSTQPELLADAAVGGLGVRPITTAPANSAAANTANATRRRTRWVGNIRSGPRGTGGSGNSAGGIWATLPPARRFPLRLPEQPAGQHGPWSPLQPVMGA